MDADVQTRVKEVSSFFSLLFFFPLVFLAGRLDSCLRMTQIFYEQLDSPSLSRLSRRGRRIVRQKEQQPSHPHYV